MCKGSQSPGKPKNHVKIQIYGQKMSKYVTEFEQNYLSYIHVLLSQLSNKLKIKSLRALESS